ncbi:hypothetical protein BC827DRAFT_280764 [Russula dissimulans]|nr:hypothetical protein BC827DRAFT_280764 [Russula dissimulans]
MPYLPPDSRVHCHHIRNRIVVRDSRSGPSVVWRQGGLRAHHFRPAGAARQRPRGALVHRPRHRRYSQSLDNREPRPRLARNPGGTFALRRVQLLVKRGAGFRRLGIPSIAPVRRALWWFMRTPWGIAYVTPHVLVAADRVKEKDSTAEVEASKLECNSENAEVLSRDIRPQTPPPSSPPPPRPPSRPPVVNTIALNPRRTVAFLIPLIWRTLGLLIRALIMRLFAMLGLHLSPLVSYLRPSHPKGDIIETQANARLVERKARPSAVAKVGHATSEKGSGPSEAKSDSTSEVASAVRRCDRRRASRVFDLPKGPFSLLAHTERAVDVSGDDEKTRCQFPEVILDGERVDLKITALGHGWVIMQTKADVNGGKAEMYVYNMEASTENGRSR